MLYQGLISENEWERASSLYKISSADLSKPDILEATVILLDDTTFFDSAAAADLEPGLKALITPPEQCISPEIELQGPQISMVAELAEHVLKNKMPATWQSLKIITAYAAQSKESIRSKIWLDDNFHDFSWPDPFKAFKYYIQVLWQDRAGYLCNVFLKADSEYRKWAIDFAISCVPPFIEILNLAARSDCEYILTALENAQKLTVNMLPLLANLALNFPRVLKLMERIEAQGHLLSSGYLGLFNNNAAKRFRKYLEQGEQIKEAAAQDLISRFVKIKKYPVDFPLVLLMRFCKVDFALQHISKNVPAAIKKDILFEFLKMDLSQEHEYNVLYEYAKLGGLKENRHLAKRFWQLLKKRHIGLFPPAEYDHPFIVLNSNKVMPPNFKEALFEFLKEDLISSSFFLKALTDISLREKEISIVRQAVLKEIIDVDRKWKQEKEDRIKDPEKYWYDDRKAPTSILALRSRIWEELRDFCMRMSFNKEIKMIDKLCAIPWQSVLKKLTEKKKK